MSHKIPIVAFATTAVRETLGKAALVWDEYDPELIAASIDKIMCDEDLRFFLGYRGWQRYRELFANDKIGQRFLKSLGTLLRGNSQKWCCRVGRAPWFGGCV